MKILQTANIAVTLYITVTWPFPKGDRNIQVWLSTFTISAFDEYPVMFIMEYPVSRRNRRMNERIYWMNEWMNERMNEWMNPASGRGSRRTTVVQLTVQALDSIDIILFQRHVGHVPSVVRVHDCIPDRRVTDSKRVTEFVHSNPQKVRTTWSAVCESFVFVKVRAPVWWVVGVSQCSSWSVKVITAVPFAPAIMAPTTKAGHKNK